MTDTTIINSSTINKNSNNSFTVFRNGNGNGDLVDCLSVGVTGITNYVPYVHSSNPTRSLDQIGGYTDISGVTTVSTPNFSTFTNITFPSGTYILNSNMKVSSASTMSISSANSFIYFNFSTASGGFQNSTVYQVMPLEYRVTMYTTNTSANGGEFHRHNSIIVNLASTTTIYLNYQVSIGTTVTCTLNYAMNAARIA